MAFSLVPNKCNKEFQFKAENPKQTEIWYNTVRENLQSSLGAKRPLDSLNSYYRFWRVPFNLT